MCSSLEEFPAQSQHTHTMAAARAKDTKGLRAKETEKTDTPQSDDAQATPSWLAPVLVLAVWGSFLLFGWATEALTRSKYKYTNEAGEEQTEKFKFTSVMTLAQCSFNSIIAVLVLISQGKFNFLGGVKLYHWLIVAGGLLGAHKFGYGALAYIPFSLQVMVKSAKTIPVLIGDVIIAGARPKFNKLVEVFMLTVGIVWFLYNKPSKKGGGESSYDNLAFGLGMAALALVCDGLYGPYQNRIINVHKPKPTSWHMMLNANFWQALMCIPFCMYPKQGWRHNQLKNTSACIYLSFLF